VVRALGHELARGHNADQLAVFHHRQVPNPQPLHAIDCLLPARVGVDRVRLRGHPVADRNGLPLGRRSARLAEEVALGEDAEQLVVFVGDQYGSDAMGVHQVHGRLDRLVRGDADRLRGHDAADGEVGGHGHPGVLCPPRIGARQGSYRRLLHMSFHFNRGTSMKRHPKSETTRETTQQL
jgi:hypothetical protein